MTHQDLHEAQELTAEELDGFGIEDLEMLLETATEELEPRVAPEPLTPDP